MLRKFQTQDKFPTGFTVFSIASGISRLQFYDLFSTVLPHPPAGNAKTHRNNCINFITRALHEPCISIFQRIENRVNLRREHMTMDMQDIFGAIIALTALARLIFV
jgi:hypothetical protein